MARKRMISPEMWDSQSFGELSILAKVLFIGMISQADDDGKGVLSAPLLKGKILPYDELRIADIDKALREIGHKPSANTDGDKAREEASHKLSVTYYEVDGKEYYRFDNWRKWQTINRPIPSKLPNPPSADGEGEDIHSHGVFSDNSMSTHTQLNEYSRPIEDIKEKNIDIDNKTSASEFEERLNEFCKEYGVKMDDYSPYLADLDFEKLNTAYSQSKKFLQVHPCARSISWIIKKYTSIIAGKYKDKAITPRSSRMTARERGSEILDDLYNQLSDVEANDEQD